MMGLDQGLLNITEKIMKSTEQQEQKKESKEDTSSYLQSQLLIAMPAMGDPTFKQTVTLICQHNEEGCFGLTINRPIQITLDELFDQLHIETQSANMKSEIALKGGPVQPDQGFVIHDSVPNADSQGDLRKTWENTLTINDDLAVTASRDILFDIAKGEGPKNYLLALGCASWTAGQIEQEVLDNAWLNCPSNNKILFDTPYEKRWNSAIDTLGFDVNLISHTAGHA